MEEDQEIKQRSDFTELCRRNELKATPQRFAVYRELISSDQHPSADIIYNRIKPDFPSLTFDTVFRTLTTFARIGIADVVEGYDRTKRFDPNLDDHHHLHCIECGDIIDFYSDKFDSLVVPRHVKEGFTILSKRVVVNGICANCKNK